tara:strand:- start:31 stop:717 length:687 start_codon:yes stop_codon:yes gene_type:complete
MASSYYKLDISSRNQTRTKGAKAVRKKGFIPGVLYYAGEDTLNISIEKSILFRAMQSGQRIFEVEQDGETQYTMIKQIQYHPVTDEIIHIDLMRVRRSEKMTISVPLVLVGEPIGVKEGGVLSQSMTQVEISCYPTDVPEQIELNIENLEVNSSLSVGDLDVGLEDVDVIADASLNIVSVTPPAAEEEIVEEEIEDDEGAIEVEESEESSQEKSDESSTDDTDVNTDK